MMVAIDSSGKNICANWRSNATAALIAKPVACIQFARRAGGWVFTEQYARAETHFMGTPCHQFDNTDMYLLEAFHVFDAR